MKVLAGSVNVSTYFAMRLTADGTAATGLTITDFDLQYVRNRVAPSAKVDATALAATDSVHADNKAIEIDATDQPGLYRVDWPDAAFAVGVPSAILTVKVATCFTEHIRVEIDHSAVAYQGEHGPGVWFDDGAANTGTVLDIDGTARNPVSTIAAVTTIAAALGVQVIYLINDTQATLAQTYEGYIFVGLGVSNKITLGSQDVDNSEFYNVILTGTQGGTGSARAIGCSLIALASAQIIAESCWWSGDIAVRAYDNHMFAGCRSSEPGDAAPTLTFPGVVSPSVPTKVSVRGHSGGIELVDGTVDDTITAEFIAGQLIIAASCNDMTVRPRGVLKYTNNGTNINIELEAAINRTGIKAEADNALDTAISELAQGVPTATPTVRTGIMLPYQALRNKLTITSTEKAIYDDAGTKIAKKAVSDDGTTYNEDKAVSGA